VLVVSLFVTLIMESPLARGPWVRSTNKAPSLQVSLSARATKLGEYSDSYIVRDKNEHLTDIIHTNNIPILLHLKKCIVL